MSNHDPLFKWVMHESIYETYIMHIMLDWYNDNLTNGVKNEQDNICCFKIILFFSWNIDFDSIIIW